LLKSVKIDGFESIFDRFWPVFEPKSVKIQGLKSFWSLGWSSGRTSFTRL